MTGEESSFARFDPSRVPSPCYVIDLQRLEENLRALRALGDAADVRVLLALKAFSLFPVADLVMRYLDGTAASGLFEARLGRTHFGGEVHTYAPGLKPETIEAVLDCSDHLVLNTLSQRRRFADWLDNTSDFSIGLRVNPEHREVENPLYDPCAPWSRLGEPVSKLGPDDLEGFDGLHVHGLCDHGFEAFERMLRAVEARMRRLFSEVDWINLGGGLLMTAKDFPLAHMVETLKGFRRRTGLEVYLEPGTAVALNAGAFVTEVLDINRTYGNVAILDGSATCHMPDVIEAGYTPDLLGAETIDPAHADARAQEPEVWRFGGPTCLAGDILGTYRRKRAPEIGERLIFLDLAYYTMVKSTTFNGTPLPAIALWDPRSGELRVVKEFGYQDFEGRLG